MIESALQHLRVLDLTHVLAGPSCTMLLGDLGADVVKVEPPEGEIGRLLGPPWVGGASVISMSVNRNKRSLGIDLKNPAGHDAFLRLVRNADVLVESFRPGVMDRLGLDYEQLSHINPRLVYCSISAFGQTGRNRGRTGVDGIAQAASGLMSVTGNASDTPSKVATPVSDMVTGQLACICVLAALADRERTGRGQSLDVSLFNASVMLQQSSMASFFASGKAPNPTGSAAPYACPNEAYPTKDGWIQIAAYQPEAWIKFLSVLDLSDIADDERFIDNLARVHNREALATLLGEQFSQDTSHHWEQRLLAAGVMCAEVADYAAVAQSTAFAESGLDTVVEHPDAGRVRMPGFAPGPSTPARPPGPPPRVGEHSVALLREAGLPDTEVQQLARTGVIATSDTWSSRSLNRQRATGQDHRNQVSPE